MVQLSFASLTRVMSRRVLLGAGGMLFGGGFAAQALAGGFGTFAIPNVVSRIGASPQHPVGNGLLAEQFPPQRRGFAISAHIAGGNVGTVIVAIIGAPMILAFGWRITSVLFGIPAIVIAIAMLILIREDGSDRLAARAHGSVRDAFRQIWRDRDLRWLYLTSILGGGGRGLGVANLFALLYLTRVIGLGDDLSGAMYGALIVFSVPTPLIAGWLSDKLGRKPIIVGVYIGGAVGVRRLHPRGLEPGRAVGRDRDHGPVQLRREPAAPGAPRRHHAARRSATRPSPCTSRSRSASAPCGWPPTA